MAAGTAQAPARVEDASTMGLTEAGRRFKVPSRTLRKAIIRGWLPARNLQGMWLVHVRDVADWHRQHYRRHLGPPRREETGRPQPRADRAQNRPTRDQAAGAAA